MKHQLDSGIPESVYRDKVEWLADNLCFGLGKVDSRFVMEAILGITESGSVRLTSMGRALEENIPLHATHKRLSRNLSHTAVGEVLLKNLVQLGARQITNDTLLVLFTNDLEKKYAVKMAYIGDIDNQGSDGFRKGYEQCELVGAGELLNSTLVNLQGDEEILPPRDFVPLSQKLWSRSEPGFVGGSNHILGMVQEVRNVIGNQGIIVSSQHLDDHDMLRTWVDSGTERFIVRQRIDSQLIYRNSTRSVHDLVDRCNTPYGATVFSLTGERERGLFIHFGFLPVQLLESPLHPLFLVVVKGLPEPLALLTTEPMRRNRKIVQWIIEAYFEHWRIKVTNRQIKLDYQFSDVRVLTYERLKNMATLLQATAYFDSLWPAGRATLKGIKFERRNRERNSPQ